MPLTKKGSRPINMLQYSLKVEAVRAKLRLNKTNFQALIKAAKSLHQRGSSAIKIPFAIVSRRVICPILSKI